MTTATTLSKRKLIDALKQAKVATDGMNDNMFLYSVGRNGLVDWLLVSVMCGDFDSEKEEGE